MKNGYTIPELLIVSSIFAIVVGIVSLFATTYFSNYTFSFEQNQSFHLAQTAMTQMTSEIREARTSAEGGWPLLQTDDFALTFYSDITEDGLTERIRYFIDGTDLRKGVIEPSTSPPIYRPENETYATIATNVDVSTGPIFTYYNGNWPADTISNPLASGDRIANTRFISINLVINVAPNSGAQPFTLTTGVQLRGLKDNL